MFFPQTADPAMAAFYDAEAKKVGNPTGMTMGPEEGAPTTVFVAESLDQGWAQYGSYMLHDAFHIENGWEKVTTLPVLAKHQQFLNCEMKMGHTGSSPPKKQLHSSVISNLVASTPMRWCTSRLSMALTFIN